MSQTIDGGQAMGEELRHVQMSMSRWSKHAGEWSKQQQGLLWGRVQCIFDTIF